MAEANYKEIAEVSRVGVRAKSDQSQERLRRRQHRPEQGRAEQTTTRNNRTSDGSQPTGQRVRRENCALVRKTRARERAKRSERSKQSCQANRNQT